jgi:hypothetical protein
MPRLPNSWHYDTPSNTLEALPLSGCKRNFMNQPVVALRLPTATFLNRFTVNHKKRNDQNR